MTGAYDETLFRITPDSHYIVITQRAGEDLRAMPGLRGTFADQRAVIVGALETARVLPDTVRLMAPPRPQRQSQGTALVLGNAWLLLHLDTAQLDVHVQCQVVTGSPAGWQRYTAILRHPHVVHPAVCAAASQGVPGAAPCWGRPERQRRSR